MIGKPILLMRVPNQRVFSPKPAALYLGLHPQTLKKITDEGQIRAKWQGNRKVYLLEELDRYIESLHDYNPNSGENPGQKGAINAD
ncbi:helix-turn-helix domain-containing protein [Acidobacteria bacterium AH-259-D05]|nr:helix-turn-helix domain-containing protein [Acidobacteria bacterium AH-259-D05]